MGQAWCKEKTSKAQDSKSPLDRVFVRCAHRIYPGLKEEGSVLGGATQRVTSSEIGYAGSPPREVLTRGRSIDSVDRPFHPSDWVDVNLEVPSTPRASSVLTNLTVDTSLYPATTPTSSSTNLKDATPIPPPRRRKRNRGRPLPPKPDEIPENITSNLKHVDTGDEPLYSSVKSPKTSGDEQDVEGETRGTSKSRSSVEGTKQTSEGKKKEIYEHKINGTGRIISSDIVSGKKVSCEKRGSKTSESSQHRRVHETEEYEKFARNQSIKDTSTPNRQDRRRSKDFEKQIENTPREGRSEVNARTKNYSTVSLPNYDELDVERHLMKRTKDEDGLEKTKLKRPVRSSTGSLPAESFLSPFSEKTSVRLEEYIPPRGSIEPLSPYQVLERLDCTENGVSEGGFVKYDPSKLEDWDLSDISNCELNHRQHSRESSPVPEIGSSNFPGKFSSARSGDVVDYSQDAETGEKEVIEKVSSFDDRDVPYGSTSLQKPEAFGKTPTPVLDFEKDLKNLDGWFVTSNRSLRYFDPPTMSEVCKNSTTCDSGSSSVHREPFFLNEEKQRSAVDTIGGSCGNSAVPESDRSEQSRMIFGRSLSNESEPCDDSYEPKELRTHSAVTASNLIRPISEESLPREMLLEDTREDFFGEKLAKDAENKMKKDCAEGRTKTPPPSPEPKIKAEILDNDHSSLLKILKEEAEGSNLSSMTPSLTELEAALSDMLEKEEEKEEDDENGYERIVACKPSEKPIEPKIIPVEKKSSNAFQNESESVEVNRSQTGKTDGVRGNDDKSLVELTDNADVKVAARGRKVSFCAWEETRMMDIELTNENCVDQKIKETPKIGTCLLDEAPEKPGRLPKGTEENSLKYTESVPTPPRRKHKGNLGILKEDDRTVQNGSTDELYHNDRLI